MDENATAVIFFRISGFLQIQQEGLVGKGRMLFQHKRTYPSQRMFRIKRAGWLDRYDAKLKAICDKFNHIENTPDEEATDERLIHTSKVVFHTPNSENEILSMFSALLDGGYIAADTTFAAFKGIFDETVFEQPIVWIKTQSRLMYFAHLAFKPHNPYDVWVKCVNCFRLQNGKAPNRESMDSNFRFIVKKGLLETYDIRLKTIADNYLSSKEKDTASSMEVSAST